MRILRTLFIISVAIFAGKVFAQDASAKSADADWPQWRGPDRNGIAANSPKLLDSWPKEGPKLLWKSAPIFSGPDGGSGSVVVADGRAFVYVNRRVIEPREKIFTSQLLKDLDWMPGIPDEVAGKIEAERLSSKRWTLKGVELDEYNKKFIATLDPAWVEKYGDFIHKRLNGEGKIAWVTVVALTQFLEKDPERPSEVIKAAWLAGELANFYTRCGPWAEMTKKKDNATRNFDTVICLDAKTGRENWRTEFPGDSTPSSDFIPWGASGTPAVCGDKVYAAGSSGLYCLAVKDGAIKWQAKTGFNHSSPLVLDGKVIVRSAVGKTLNSGVLAAYDATSGNLLWTQPKVSWCLSSSVTPWTCGGKTFLICLAGNVCCIEPDKGELLWQAPCGAACSTPVVSGDNLVVLGDKLSAFKITPQKAELIWKQPFGDRGSSPLVYQDHVYLFCGHANSDAGPKCFDLKTGEIKWKKYPLGCECSSPILADGKIIARCAAGNTFDTLYLYKAMPEKYEELGKFQPSNVKVTPCLENCASPTVAGGKLFWRSEEFVACYDLAVPGP